MFYSSTYISWFMLLKFGLQLTNVSLFLAWCMACFQYKRLQLLDLSASIMRRQARKTTQKVDMPERAPKCQPAPVSSAQLQMVKCCYHCCLCVLEDRCNVKYLLQTLENSYECVFMFACMKGAPSNYKVILLSAFLSPWVLSLIH